jgi:hypothetical protein
MLFLPVSILCLLCLFDSPGWGSRPRPKKRPVLRSAAAVPISIVVTGDNRLSYVGGAVPRYRKFEAAFRIDGLTAKVDYNPFNPNIHPNARDIPDNGIDENCNGRDFSTKGMPSYKIGQRMPVPDAYRRDWNFLLVTIDATRYDHTGFGGYKKAEDTR